MRTLSSLLEKLMPLGLYDLSEESNIYLELSCYSEALERHRENIDETLRECFISSAESFGLENRERVIGSVVEGYSTEDRRKMLILRQSMGENDFTYDGFRAFLNSLGVFDYNILELSKIFQLAIHCCTYYGAEQEKWIENQIQLMAPAHISTTVYFSGISWTDFEIPNMTFDYVDSLDKSWFEIDSVI